MKNPRVQSLDHLVLTVADIGASIAFYRDVLGMEAVTVAGGRRALAFGSQKIDLHVAGAEVVPHARVPAAGSADLCLLVAGPVAHIAEDLRAEGIAVELGPVPRTGATGPLLSIYLRDPDGNLIELSNLA